MLKLNVSSNASGTPFLGHVRPAWQPNIIATQPTQPTQPAPRETKPEPPTK